MTQRMPAKGADLVVGQDCLVMKSMVDSSLTGDLADGFKDSRKLRFERFVFHIAVLCNNETGIYKKN